MGRRKARHERGLSNLLDVDFLRRVLGFDPNDFDKDVYANDQGQRPLILVFHDGDGDEAKLKNIGWHPFKHGAAIATLDTKWILEDNHEFSGFPLGLSDLVVKFEIPRRFEWQQPNRKKGKRVVRGHHNAGNDAFETMAALLGQAAHEVSDKALTEPPIYPYPNNEPVLVAIDTEWYEDNPRPLTEIGICILDTALITETVPGPNCENWMDLTETHHLAQRVILCWPEAFHTLNNGVRKRRQDGVTTVKINETYVGT